jgi:hypothetical protein
MDIEKHPEVISLSFLEFHIFQNSREHMNDFIRHGKYVHIDHVDLLETRMFGAENSENSHGKSTR